MKNAISYLTKIEGIPVYKDPSMDENHYIVSYQQSNISPDLIYIPIDIYNKGLLTSEGVTIDKKEVDEILKKKQARNFSDIKCIICNIDDTEEDFIKLANSFRKNFNI